MNQHSQNELLEAQIRECYGRVVWTHKTQEKCSDILAKRNSRIKLAQIVLSALTTTGIFIAVFGDKNLVDILLIKVIKREKKTANSMYPIMLTVHGRKFLLNRKERAEQREDFQCKIQEQN